MDDRIFVNILRDRAQVSGDKIAYRFLVDGDKEELTLTYGQLHQRALGIALVLKDEVKPGDRALLLYPPGLDFICAFFGCLYAGVIAVPAYPPNPHRLQSSLDRLETMVQDSDPSIILGTNAILSIIKLNAVKDSVLHIFRGRHENMSMSRSLAQLKKINTEKIKVAQSSIIMPYEAKSNELAYLQYTSGSTGNPKGVMISHLNIIDNTQQIYSRAFDKIEFMVCWLPLYHDMGLVNTLFMPLLSGADIKFFSPLDFIRNPAMWLKTVSSSRTCYSGGPNFGYDLLLRKLSDEDLFNLDLSNWKVAFSGAEAVKYDTFNKFSKRFSVCGFDKSAFYPCYGLAEVTVALTGRDLSNGDENTNIVSIKDGLLQSDQSNNVAFFDNYISCGYAIENHNVVIVCPDSLRMLSKNSVGEIWCKGLSVAQGYWGNEEATKETFNAYTADGGGPFLRTGDLGFMRDGELYIVGRLKDMIIIRGRNYAPQDVECAVEATHEGIRKGCVAAFGFEEEGVEKLGVVCEVKRAFVKKEHDEIIQAIIENITRENELSVSAIVLLKPGQIFKTTSGKIQRRKTKQAFLDSDFNMLTRWRATDNHVLVVPNEPPISQEVIEQQLKSWLASRLGLNKENINRNAAFMDLNLDSIATVEASDMLSSWLQQEINPAVFLEHASVASLSDFLAELIGLVKDGKRSSSPVLTHEKPKSTILSKVNASAIAKRLAGARAVVRFLLKLVCRVEYIGLSHMNPACNYIIVSNHTCKLDNSISLSLLPRTIALASDSHFHGHFLGRLMRYCGFIIKEKNAPDPAAIQSLLAAVKAGFNIYVSPEGEMSWDGQLQAFRPGLGALLKTADTPVLIVRYHNGFRHSPRWSKRFRKAKVLCEIQEPLVVDKSMPNAQLEALIKERLSFDKNPEMKFESHSKRFAEGLENPIWICPACKSIDSLSSKYKELSCDDCSACWTIGQDANLIDTANRSLPLSAVIKQVESVAHKKIESGALRRLRSKNTVKLYRYSHGKLRCETKGVLYIDDNFIGIEGKYPLQLDFSGVENVNLDISKRLHIKHNGVYYEFGFAANESACKWQYLLNKAKSSVGLLVKDEVCKV